MSSHFVDGQADCPEVFSTTLGEDYRFHFKSVKESDGIGSHFTGFSRGLGHGFRVVYRGDLAIDAPGNGVILDPTSHAQ
jgi:hypothetical protein